jgi:hypothetical protein
LKTAAFTTYAIDSPYGSLPVAEWRMMARAALLLHF